MLELLDLRVVLGSLSLRIRELTVDGRVVIIGRNGSGKTTLLRAIAGHLRPLGGRVMLGGEDITELRPEERPLAYIPQQPVRLPMKPLQQLRYFARLWGADPDEVVSKLGLGGILGKERLSDGEAQLLALATALLKRPKAMLLDEPASSLDWPSRQLLWGAVKELDIPILYVTHDPVEAVQVADELCLLEAGELRSRLRNRWREAGEGVLELLDLYRVFR